MANFQAWFQIDSSEINASWFTEWLQATYPYDGINITITSVTYTDALVFNSSDGVSDLGLALLGHWLTYDNSGNVTDGIITAISEFFWDGDDRWFLSNTYFEAKTLFDALLTPSTVDETQLWLNAFSGNDYISLSDFDDVFDGYVGNDWMEGNGGSDLLIGNYGNDRLDGGAGADDLFGGAGNDTYVVDDGVNDHVYETTTALGNVNAGGTDTVLAYSDYWALSKFVENLTFMEGAASDSQTGLGNVLANKMVGNSEANVLNGKSGNDVINGNGGNDWITGGLGRDILTGGAGLDFDHFLFYSSSEIGKGLGLRDIIRDFSVNDQIDLTQIDTKAAAGDQAFKFRAVEGTSFTGIQGQLIWDKQNIAGTVNDRTVISGDINGDRVADFQLELTGLINLTTADFML